MNTGDLSLLVRVRATLAQGVPSKELTRMTAAHVLALLERFPMLYREGRLPPSISSCPFAVDGFACGDGWYGIIEKLSTELSTVPHVFVGRIRETHGLLSVYLESDLDLRLVSDVRDKAHSEAEAEADVAIYAVRIASASTCELCGAPGGLVRRPGRVEVRCASCALTLPVEAANDPARS